MAEDIQKHYPSVCNGIGKLKNYQAKIHIHPNVTPVAQHKRRIPFVMHEKLEAKIQVQGHPKIDDFGTNRKHICNFLLVIIG